MNQKKTFGPYWQTIRKSGKKLGEHLKIFLTPRRSRIIVGIIFLIGIILTTWLAWPSFYETTSAEADGETDYLPYQLFEGDILRQTFVPQQKGLQELALSFDLSANSDLPQDTLFSLDIYRMADDSSVLSMTLTSEELRTYTQTAIPISLGRGSIGQDYELVLTVLKLSDEVTLSIHTTHALNYPLVVNQSQTGLAMTMVLTYSEFNQGIFALVLFMTVIIVLLLALPLRRMHQTMTRFTIIPIFAAPGMTLIIIELLNTLNVDFWLKPQLIFLSYLVILLIELFLLGLIGRSREAIYLTMTLFVIIGMSNHVKLFFRGDPFVIGDIRSLVEAAEGVNKLKFEVSSRFLLALLFAMVSLLLFAGIRHKKRSRKFHLCVMLASAVLFVSGYNLVLLNGEFLEETFKIDRYPWNNMMNYKQNGVTLPFLQSISNMIVRVPTEDVTVSPTMYEIDQTEQREKADPDKPNVIAIMSESFSDFSNINDLATSEPYIPFYDSLKNSDNTISGNLLVSIFGGGTCNTEFEFLTGSTMLFMNDGSIPYVNYFNRRTHSLADLYSQQGYRTLAIHPYLRSFWDRNTVYSNIGFDRFMSLEDFPQEGFVRDFMGDQADYDQIIQAMEDKEANERLFLFSVTMQNHFPYYSSEEILSGLKYNIKIPGMTDVESVELYLSLLRQSDDALKSLVTYLSDLDEPTLLVIFGDHLPGNNNCFNSFYENMFGKTIADLSLAETQKLYETPFMIWANYDLPEDDIDVISPNFLGTYVLNLSGAATSPYFAAVDQLGEEIQAMSGKMILMKSGIRYDEEHIPMRLVKKLDRYWAFEYDNIIADRE